MSDEYVSVVKEMGRKFPVMNIIVDIGNSDNVLYEKELSDCYVKYELGISNIIIKEIKQKG